MSNEYGNHFINNNNNNINHVGGINATTTASSVTIDNNNDNPNSGSIDTINTSTTYYRHNDISVRTASTSTTQQGGSEQELQISNEAGTWEAIQRNLPAINAAGLQLSASAGMTNNNNNDTSAKIAGDARPYDSLQAAAAAGIHLSTAGLLVPASAPSLNSNTSNSQTQQTFTQSQQQTAIVSGPGSGRFSTVQSVVAPPPTAAAAASPYILLKPQHISINPTTTATTTGPSSIASGSPLDAVAAAAGLMNYGGAHLLFNPASIFAATQSVTGQIQGQVPTVTGQLSGQIPLQIHQQTHPQLILPGAVSQQSVSAAQSQSQSKKRTSELFPSISAIGVNNAAIINQLVPSIVSSTITGAPTNTKRSDCGQKRQRIGGNQTRVKMNEESISNVTDPAEKRRFERNLREQQRSSKISSQIKELRELLSECNVPFKPNKYSILLKVVEYIKQLQSRAIMLDAEHQKLLTTVRQTNEMIANAGKTNSNGMSSTTTGGTDNDSSDTMCVDNDWRRGSSQKPRESDLFFVKGIDYGSVFDQCPTALGIAALDGRILECNTEFQSLLGYQTREDLMKQSLFNLVHNHQDIFRAMAQMLKVAEEPHGGVRRGGSGMNTTNNNNNNNNTANINNDDRNVQRQEKNGSLTNDDSSVVTKSTDRFWTGPVTSKQNMQLSMNITLTLGDNGTPKFFSCALTNTS